MGVLEETIRIRTEEARRDTRLLQEQLDGLERKLSDTYRSADRLERGAGALGSGLTRVSGALSQVSPAAGNATRTLGDLADVFEVGAMAGKAMGVGMGSILAVLGPVTIALAAGTLAWKYFTDQMERAEAAAKKAGEAAQLAGQRAAGRDAFAAENTRLTNLASGALSSRDDKRNQLGAGLLPSFQPEMEAAKAAFAAALDAGDQAGMAAATRTLGALQDRLGGMVEIRLQAEEALERQAQAEKNAASAARDHAAATREAAAAEAQRIQNFLGGLALGKVQADFAAADFAGAQGAADTFAAQMQQGLTAAENEGRFAAVRQDFAAELAQTAQRDALGQSLAGGRGAAAQGFGALLGGNVTGGLGQMLTAGGGNLANRAAFLGQNAQGATGGALAGLGGMALGGLGAAMGPMGLLAGMGAMTATDADGNVLTGADAMRENLTGLKDAIVMGVEMLPEVIGEVLPAFAIALATELPPALLAALPKLFEAVLRAVLPDKWEDFLMGSDSTTAATLTTAQQLNLYMQQDQLKGAGTGQQAALAAEAQSSRSARAMLGRGAAGRFLEDTSPTRILGRGGGLGNVNIAINAIAADGSAIHEAARELTRLYGPDGLRPGGLP